MESVLGFILGGGRGAGLYPLTRHRSTPAVTIAGKYRLIDVPISNCINSGIMRMYVLTQFLSVSLHRHISNTFKFAPFSRAFVEVLPAQQTNETTDWYKGTADALRQNLRYIASDQSDDVLILSGDGLYRMNYAAMVEFHRESQADLTIAVVPVRRGQASNLGVLKLDEQNRVSELVEKPRSADQLDLVRASPTWLENRGLSGSGRDYMANMGVYLLRRKVLLEMLQGKPEAVDLVTQHFTRILRTHSVRAYLFDGYWQDLGGSIRAYHEAQLALASDSPPFDFHSPDGVIYTRMRNLPASRIRASHMEHSLISDGCVIDEETRIERCCLGPRTRVGKRVTLRDSIITGADYLETPNQLQANLDQGIPHIGIGDGAIVQRAILDKGCRIGQNVRITNEKELRDADGENYVIRDGIVVIPRGAIVPDGTVI
ncbi:MAG: sugar phosphate nucleotidyltransferase [Gemmataceae bacterium]